jgi:hypothetical protein
MSPTKQKVESWQELQRDAAALRDRIERRIDAEVVAMKEHCHNQPISSLRAEVMRGSSNLLAIVERYARSCN